MHEFNLGYNRIIEVPYVGVSVRGWVSEGFLRNFEFYVSNFMSACTDSRIGRIESSCSLLASFVYIFSSIKSPRFTAT